MVDSNFKLRVLSSIVIFLVFSFSIYFSDLSFYLLILSIVMISSFEWYKLTGSSKVWCFLGLPLIVAPNASLIYLYAVQGNHILMLFISTIWGIDVAAYLFGKNFGGPRICPIISPGKTWSGLLGAILAGVMFAIFASIFFGLFPILSAPVIGFIIAIVAQIGDFTESIIKRISGVKDSSDIIPGHGGVLDRMDGFIFTAPLIVMYIN